MTLALWLGVAAFLVGLTLRLWAHRPFVDAYGERHGGRPPLSYLWTPSADPTVERWRRYTTLGTALLWIGAIVAILNPAP